MPDQKALQIKFMLMFMLFMIIMLNQLMFVYKKTNEWYIEWQLMTTSGTTSNNEW